MRIEYDPAKSEKNILERRLSFDRALEFDWSSAIFAEDDRYLYSERRFVAVGLSGKQAACDLFYTCSRGSEDYQFSQGKRPGGKTAWQSAYH